MFSQSVAPEEGGATLNDTYELLKRELALEGNVSDVVAAAARALGVSPEGSIMDQAARCRAALLGGASRPQPAVVQGTIVEAAPIEAQVLGVVAPPKAQFFAVPQGAPSRFEVSLYSPKSQYLTNDRFGQSLSPVPWTIEIVEGRTVRLQGANGRYLRSDGREGSPPAWTTEPDRTTEWHLLFAGDGILPNDDTPVQLKSPSNGGREMCLCNDTPTGGWGGSVKHKYSWCPEGRGDAFWRLRAWRGTAQQGSFAAPGAAAMERGDLISPGDLQGCWVGCALCYVLWCANIRAVDADTCFGRRPLTARRGDPRLARYAHDFCCLVIPFKGREYRRTPGSNRFVWTVESGRNPANPEQDWERFYSKSFAVGAPGGARWLCRVCPLSGIALDRLRAAQR